MNNKSRPLADFTEFPRDKLYTDKEITNTSNGNIDKNQKAVVDCGLFEKINKS